MYDFSKKYNREEFLEFLKIFLPNDFELKNAEYKITNKNLIINKITQLGRLSSLENLVVFEIEHKSDKDPRTSLTKELCAALNKLSINYALVIFYSPESSNYRLSFVESNYEWKTDTRVLKKFSHPRRLSFLLGENAKIHTPTNQLNGKILDLTDLRKRFDIEVVTDEFFQNYRKLYFSIKKYLEKDKQFCIFAKKINLNITVFSKKLLGQIVFCYFIQKKGWLGVKKNEFFGNGDVNFLKNKFKECLKLKKNFFNDFLEYLFYSGFNKENKDDYLKKLNIKVPYLNGGLFEELHKYDWKNEYIEIPNSIFSNNNKNGILDIFDLYNFTVDENSDLEIDLAIDPEMLGKVFENLLEENVREEQGAYYTPREIVFYMCRNSLVNYLANVFKDKLNKKKIVNFISLASNFYLGNEFNEEDNKTLEDLKKHSKSLDQKLEKISICDPAIGSGAFPIAMMNEVVKLRFFLAELNKKKYSLQSLKKHFIKNSIYGVDIEPSAVEIAKLRLWLSLVVDVVDYKKIDPLPNLDYKIMQGDSLIDEYYGVSFNEKKDDELFGNHNNADEIIKSLFKKQQEYYDLVNSDDKELKRKEVNDDLKKIFNIALDDQLNKKKLRTFQNKEVDKNIENIQVDLINMSKAHTTRKFFFWKLFFSGVFSEKKGFDIVIANPPYVFTRDVDWTDSFKEMVFNKYLNFSESQKSGRVQSGKINLYVIFMLQSLHLLNDKGVSCFIIPNGFLRSIIYPDVRKKLLLGSQFLEIVDLKSKAFKGVTVSPIIFLFDKTNTHQKSKRSFEIIDANFARDKYVSRSEMHKVNQSNYIKNVGSVLNIKAKEEDLSVLLKIKTTNFFLENVTKCIIEGVVAHKNIIFDNKNEPMCVPLIQGSEVRKNYLLNEKKYLKLEKKKIHRLRPDYVWKAEKKIIIRRISGGKKPLICAIDKKKNYSFASTNLLILLDNYIKIYPYEFLALLINSDLMNYFYSKSFSNESELTVNVATTFLEKLPLPILTDECKKEIQIIAESYEKLEKYSSLLHEEKDNKELLNKIKFLEKEINQKIFKIYNLDTNDIFVINSNYQQL